MVRKILTVAALICLAVPASVSAQPVSRQSEGCVAALEDPIVWRTGDDIALHGARAGFEPNFVDGSRPREDRDHYVLLVDGEPVFCVYVQNVQTRDGRDFLFDATHQPWRMAEVNSLGRTEAFQRLGELIVARLPERCLVLLGCEFGRYRRAARGAEVLDFGTYIDGLYVTYLAVFFRGEYLGLIEWQQNANGRIIRDVRYQ